MCLAGCINNPRPINHVGVSVPDADAVVDWYTKVMGFQLMAELEANRAEQPDNPVFLIFPPSLNIVKVKMMTSGDGVGFEVFQFVDPPYQKPEKTFEEDYTRGGYFHICVTNTDVNAQVAKIVENGGKHLGQSITFAGAEVGYTEDPWGNVIEILSVSFDRVATRIADEAAATPSTAKQESSDK